MKESILQSQCIDYLMYLENQGILWFSRISMLPIMQEDKRTGRIIRRSMPRGGKKGISDLLVFFNKKTIWIELKSQAGKQSKFQIEFKKSVESFSGGKYYVIKTFDELINILKSSR